MKLSPRTTFTFTLGLLTVGLLTGCGGPVTETATTSGALNPCPNNQQTLTIAALEPKPGTGQGTLGNIAALQLAVKDINNAGGTLNTETKYAIGYHDPNPTLATIHTTKDLINVGTPVIIGPTTSELTLAILDITTSALTVFLCWKARHKGGPGTPIPNGPIISYLALAPTAALLVLTGIQPLT